MSLFILQYSTPISKSLVEIHFPCFVIVIFQSYNSNSLQNVKKMLIRQLIMKSVLHARSVFALFAVRMSMCKIYFVFLDYGIMGVLALCGKIARVVFTSSANRKSTLNGVELCHL